MPKPAPEPTALTGHAVLVGYGRVGKLVARGIKDMPLLVVEEGAVGDPGIEHIRGNAARDDVLAAANLAGARRKSCSLPFPRRSRRARSSSRRGAPIPS